MNICWVVPYEVAECDDCGESESEIESVNER